ncbi:hypothetical protein [Kineococcus glutinatus]|uniref:Ribosomally synthesized peptide with SipW-like signal peptide n=1 Tax=Kineococcus glutinatus TaxID=1070872 RepID=A0ABP9HUL3_9ACTN
MEIGRRGARRLVLTTALLGTVLSGGLVWSSSHATFGGTTTSTGNTFASGEVAVSTAGVSGALFSASQLAPGPPRAACLDVVYTGDVAADVRLLVRYRDVLGVPDDGLAPFVEVTVEETVQGAGTACAARTPAGPALFAGASFDDLVAHHGAFATGLGSWRPSGSAPETRHYRVTYRIADDNAGQDLSLGVDFLWEARSA